MGNRRRLTSNIHASGSRTRSRPADEMFVYSDAVELSTPFCEGVRQRQTDFCPRVAHTAPKIESDRSATRDRAHNRGHGHLRSMQRKPKGSTLTFFRLAIYIAPVMLYNLLARSKT